MLKSLFMVWYIGGTTVLTAGPLPYDLEKCKTRATEVLAEIQEKDKVFSHFVSLEIKCEFHAERPALEN